MKKLSKYLLWAFGVAWVFQIIAGILYRKGNSMSYSALLAVSMFAPLFAAVLSGAEIRRIGCLCDHHAPFADFAGGTVFEPGIWSTVCRIQTLCVSLFGASQTRMSVAHKEDMIKMQRLLNPIYMFLSGLFLGTAARMLDIYTQNLGEIFSQMSIWILIGTLIAIYSPTKRSAMYNIFPFCIGMLLTYYAIAVFTHGVYGWSFIIGWTVFAFLSPVMAYFAWMAKGRGLFPKIIGVGIVLVSILSSVLLFDRLRIYDFAIDGLLIYFLFFKRINRNRTYK